MLNRTFVRFALAAAASLGLAACQAPAPAPGEPLPPMPKETLARGSAPLSPALTEATAKAQAGPATQEEKVQAHLYRGTGVVVKGLQPGGGLPPGPAVQLAGGNVVLNFEGADLREVVRNILGDILNANYTIDPAVGGTVTIRTSAGIPRDALPATLETLLRQNGATMVKSGGLYMVLPQAAAVRGNTTPQLGNSMRALPPGFSVQIVPLRYVGVREMLRLLEPFAKDAQAVRPDELRNLLILSGTERELRHLMDTIEMFDIDWMAGMSAGVFTLKNTDAKTVVAELEKVVGDRNLSPLTGILKILPIERLNALLVVTPQAAYLDEVKKWIERLDRSATDGGGGLQFYVYHLQNTRAERLAPLLQQAFTGRVTQQAAAAAPTLAPGTPAGTIVNPPAFSAQPAVPVANPTPAAPAPAATAPGAAAGSGIVRNLQVVADKDNNTLLIIATAAEYSVIETALKKLDIPQRQVLIEVTIAEVNLTDELQFGVEWLFRGGAPSGRGAGGLFTNTPAFNPGSGTTPANTLGSSIAQGFVYFINNAAFPGGVQAVLNLLDTYGNTKVVANPHIAALDNQKATIKAGNRIPINQQTLVGGTTNAVTTTSQYIDTGVLLQVTPHINAGGLVALDVQAEVSNPGNPAQPGDAPPINTRSVQTYVSVKSGQTMVMGGLIGDTRQNNSEGLPLLARIPFLGGLFGNQTLKYDRTELVLFITPRVVESEVDVRGAIDELRRKMENMDRLFPYIPPFSSQVFPPAPPAAPGAPAAPAPQ
ncbi:MAG: type II secretion system secretin GspD [Burkholderiales bacterium]|nr:type II secretion system secretin GspD [Burkholderiales bacterium]